MSLPGAAARTSSAPAIIAEPHDHWTSHHAAIPARTQEEEAAPTF